MLIRQPYNVAERCQMKLTCLLLLLLFSCSCSGHRGAPDTSQQKLEQEIQEVLQKTQQEHLQITAQVISHGITPSQWTEQIPDPKEVSTVFTFMCERTDNRDNAAEAGCPRSRRFCETWEWDATERDEMQVTRAGAKHAAWIEPN